VIQLTAIVSGRSFPMLTGEPIAEAEKSCIDRFGDRFQGFAPIPVEIVARAKWAQYRCGDVTRQELELWLKDQDDEQAIRQLFNAMRG